MKTLLHDADRKEMLARIEKLRPDLRRHWGKMTAHQMICHVSDSLRVSLGEKEVSRADNFWTRSVMKWAALWLPVRWPHGVMTRPEVDQEGGGTCPTEFAADAAELRTLFERFCRSTGEFGAHPLFGQISRSERMRHAYLHVDHHFRQFGI